MSNLMIKVHFSILAWMTRDEGQDTVEYALVVALIALGGIAAMHSLASGINIAFRGVSSGLATSL
jgi:pilus assembly protein Flp/PilA